MINIDYKGKVVLITGESIDLVKERELISGGGRGIGLAITTAFAEGMSNLAVRHEREILTNSWSHHHRDIHF